MIRTGVFGSGAVLEDVLEVLRQHKGFLVTGYYIGSTLTRKHKVIQQYKMPEELVSVSEAIIVTNSPGDFQEVIPGIIKNSRHLLIFPDYSLSFYHLDNVIKLAEEAGIIFYLHQDGIKDWMKDLTLNVCGRPEFIEVHSYIDKRNIVPGKNIFDSLYKAIAAVMKLNPVNVRKFHTNLVPYYSPDPLIINVRLEFENGTAASITINGFFERSDTSIEVYRGDCEVIIEPLAPEVRVIRKNPNSIEVFTKPTEGFSNSYGEGLDGFAQRLFTPGLNNDPFQSGIIAHKTATNIINQFIPYPVRSL